MVTEESNNIAARLVLGTAQLGMQYGIANRTGQPNLNAAVGIVKVAWQNGIREFDTAQGYGNSEEVLGAAIKSLDVQNQVRIITKIDLARYHNDAESVFQGVRESIKRLGINKIYGLMLHREDALDQIDSGLTETLNEIVGNGLVEQVGISVYSPERALQALASGVFSMIQIPANILDRRFEKARVFERARLKNKTIYARSVYLQGLLLMEPEDLSTEMEFASPLLQEIKGLVAATGYSRKELAMAFVVSAYPQAKLVIGAETLEQVLQNVQLMKSKLQEKQVDLIREKFIEVEERILNPAQWPTPSRSL